MLEISSKVAPDGVPSVLMQFKDGWLLVAPADARKVAAELMNCADEVEQQWPE